MGTTVIILFLLSSAAAVVAGEDDNEKAFDAVKAPAPATASSGQESVTVGQILPTSFKVQMDGAVDSGIGSALRHLLDGNATEAYSRGNAPAPLMEKVNATLASYCTAAKCRDGNVLEEEATRFSEEVLSDAYLFELLRRAGVANLSVTVEGRGPTFEERVDFVLTGAAGKVASILPVQVDYNLNQHFADAPSDRFQVVARLDGVQPPRPVAFTLVTLPGYRLDVVSGIENLEVRENSPDEGRTTLTGALARPDSGARIVLASGGLPTYCYALVVAVVGICAVAMYFGWKRSKLDQKRKARAKRRTAEQEASEAATAAASGRKKRRSPQEVELEKLARLKEQGLIT
ncbi:MAG TPA: hypothetical protein VI893_09605, partial [Thermoplasmata archaeon]|nr:hypothetical protein [Thermoplasmata archaeon]